MIGVRHEGGMRELAGIVGDGFVVDGIHVDECNKIMDETVQNTATNSQVNNFM